MAPLNEAPSSTPTRGAIDVAVDLTGLGNLDPAGTVNVAVYGAFYRAPPAPSLSAATVPSAWTVTVALVIDEAFDAPFDQKVFLGD